MRKHKVWWWGTAVSLSLLFIITSLTLAQETPTPPVMPTPTIDRLAAPPTVPSPTQADEGAQLFWLHCQPCHGDQGQGLTDEWRTQFPEEEQNCWQSGCHGEHGKDPPPTGFKIPTAVPAVIGEGSLGNFQTVQQLFYFIRTSMPYENPGGLKEEEYMAITAFIVRAHGVGDGTPLNAANIAQFRFRPAADEGETILKTEDTEMTTPETQAGQTPSYWVWSSGLVVILLAAAWRWRQQKHE